MKYKVLCLGALLILASVVSGCSKALTSNDNGRFIKVKEYPDCIIFVDKETNIEYINYCVTNSQNGFTPLLDKDGNVTHYNK